jgi:type II secretory pathway component PulF
MNDSVLELSGDFVHRLDEVLQSSNRLEQFLVAAQADVSGANKNPELTKLLTALQQRTPADQWLRDPILASLLPMVLRFHRADLGCDFERSTVLDFVSAPKRRPLRWFRQLAYPLALGLLAVAILILLSILVVPIFRSMFDEFGLVLPTPTRWVVQFSDAIVRHPRETLLAFAGSLVLFWLAGIGMHRLVDCMQKYSLFGYWFTGSRSHLLAMARWTATLAELLHLGVPKAQAVEIAGIASREYFYQEQSKRIAGWLQAGDRPLAGSPIARGISATAIHALDTSLEGEASISMLRRLSAIYRDRIEHRSIVHHGWLGPTSIIVLGMLVGFVALALLMPLFSLISSLSS